LLNWLVAQQELAQSVARWKKLKLAAKFHRLRILAVVACTNETLSVLLSSFFSCDAFLDLTVLGWVFPFLFLFDVSSGLSPSRVILLSSLDRL